MKLELAINNILSGDHVESQIDGLDIHEARTRKRKKTALQRGLDYLVTGGGWKGSVARVVGGAAALYGAYKLYSRIEAKSPQSRRKWEKFYYELYRAVISKDTAGNIIKMQARDIGRIVEQTLSDAGIPRIMSTTVKCGVAAADKAIGDAIKNNNTVPSDDEMRRMAKTEARYQFDHIPKSTNNGRSVLLQRINRLQGTTDEILQRLWDTGKNSYNPPLDLTMLVHIYSGCENATYGDERNRRLPDLTGLSLADVNNAFIEFLGMDYITGQEATKK